MLLGSRKQNISKDEEKRSIIRKCLEKLLVKPYTIYSIYTQVFLSASSKIMCFSLLNIVIKQWNYSM